VIGTQRLMFFADFQIVQTPHFRPWTMNLLDDERDAFALDDVPIAPN
jgi:hypothetical protein